MMSEVHGFANASERRFGAVVYLRQSSPTAEVQVRLVAEKSRNFVAPVRIVRGGSIGHLTGTTFKEVLKTRCMRGLIRGWH